MAPTIGVNLRVTGHCNQGGRKYMEDAFVVAYQQTRDVKDLEYAFFGIFDGHGGREAALFAKEHLMDTIVSQKNFWSDNDELVLKAIRDGFITTHLAMWKEVGKWPKTVSGLPSTSGTTSSVAFIRRGKLYIGHVGDSKIVLGYQEQGSGSWSPLPLTKDHKPESPKEKKRIYSVGGLVMNKAGVERVVWNRPRIGHKGPIRRSTPFDQIPFLAVARSLGDLWSYNYLRREFVVSPEPDVSVLTLDPRRDRCIILASDGLWNVVNAVTAVTIVEHAEEENEQIILEGRKSGGWCTTSKNPSKLLVDQALRQWCELRMRADNTSVVTVLLDPPGPPKSEVLLRQKVMQKLRPRDEQGEPESPAETDCSEAKIVIKQPIDSESISAKPANDVSSPKEKKITTTESPADGLPKPVILSPRRVFLKSPSHKEKHKRSDKAPQVANDIGEKKEPEKMPISVNSNDDGQALLAASRGIEAVDQGLVSTDLGDKSDIIPCSENSVASSSSSSEESEAGPCQSDNQTDESTPSPIIADSGKVVPPQSSTSATGRMHLSVVDNIVPQENTESCQKEQQRPPAAGVEESENKVVEESSQPVKSLEHSRLSITHKRRSQEEDGSPSPVKSLKLSGSSWLKNSSSDCAMMARDSDAAHNTRSRHQKRKLKVR